MLAFYGGTPARSEKLPPSYPGALFIDEEEKKAVVEVIESQSLFRYYGPNLLKKVDQLEAAFAKKIGVPSALAVTSGTAALRVGLTALGVGPGDEVITSPFTFIASVGSIVSVGAVPVFCDLDESLGLDPEDLERRITPYTKAIVPVHFSGVPNRMDEIMAIARKHGIPVLEDVAQSCGASYKGRMLGSIGDAGAFSMQLNKNITAGEGGMVTTGDDGVLEKAIRFHDQGFWRGKWDESQVIGENYRLNELSAAVLLVQLSKLDKIVGNMRKNKARILADIYDLKKLQLRDPVDEAGDAGNSIAVFLPSEGERVEFQKLLNAENVNCGAPYGGQVAYISWPQIREKRTITPERCSWYCSRYKGEVEYFPGLCPRAEDLVSRVAFVPVSPTLTEEDCNQVIVGIRKVYRHLYG